MGWAMGMFDSVIVFGKDQHRFVTPQGNVGTDMQSKDFDCTMTTRIISDSRLFKSLDKVSSEPTFDLDTLVLRTYHEHKFEPENFTGTARIYCYDKAAKPVLVRITTKGFRADLIDEHFPWAEWEVTFKNGGVLQVESFCETRATVRQRLQESGQLVMPDDDPIAVRFFSQREFTTKAK